MTLARRGSQFDAKLHRAFGGYRYLVPGSTVYGMQKVIPACVARVNRMTAWAHDCADPFCDVKIDRFSFMTEVEPVFWAWVISVIYGLLSKR
jgi:hypothetical protein